MQSVLDPAGMAAAKIAALSWWMFGGAALVWLGVAALTVHAARARLKDHDRWSRFLIVGCGAVLPTVVLGALLAFGLRLLPELTAPAPEGSLRLQVTGEQFWWRVRYALPEGALETANEIRIPVGEPVEFELDAADVIHSFWIPALGGKMDMIPGRRTRLRLDATRTGKFRGVCAEYCGSSHALMAFDVEVVTRAEFERWIAAQRRPAARASSHFMGNGCAACHTIRGTDAQGGLGPDLTHVGGRASLGAGTLANDAAGFSRWLKETHRVKPGALMPHYGMLPPGELRALAEYLESLR